MLQFSSPSTPPISTLPHRTIHVLGVSNVQSVVGPQIAKILHSAGSESTHPASQHSLMHLNLCNTKTHSQSHYIISPSCVSTFAWPKRGSFRACQNLGWELGRGSRVFIKMFSNVSTKKIYSVYFIGADSLCLISICHDYKNNAQG